MSDVAAPTEPEELTLFVQNLLQQMVRQGLGRLQQLAKHQSHASTSNFIFTLQQARFQAMSDAIITKIDEMGGRIDELERNISDL